MRPTDAILAELRTLHALQADTQAQLRSVRRAQLEAASHEASLLAALDGRGRKIDRVLDEYSQAMNERGKALT